MPDGIEIGKTRFSLTVQNIVGYTAVILAVWGAWWSLKSDVAANKSSGDASITAIKGSLDENNTAVNRRMDDFQKAQSTDHDILTGLKAVWDNKKP